MPSTHLFLSAKFHDDDKSKAVAGRTSIKHNFALTIKGEGGAKYPFSIVGSRDVPPVEEDLSQLEEGYEHIQVDESSVKADF
jgi:hypothetical protein